MPASQAAVITADPTSRPLKPRGGDTDSQTVMQLKTLRDVFGPLPGARRWVAEKLLGGLPPEEMVDQGWKLLSNERPVRFNEMSSTCPSRRRSLP